MWSARVPRDLRTTELSKVLGIAKSAGAIDLTASNPTLPAMELGLGGELQADLTEHIGATLAEPYEPAPLGARSAREAVARYVATHTGKVAAENVWLGASTSELYGQLFKLLCEPGEKVAVPVPSYPLFEQLAALEGVRTVPYALEYASSEGRWKLDEGSLNATLEAGVKAVLTVQPNNPTGSTSDTTEALVLAGACKRAGVPLVVDEVFGPYASGPRFASRVPTEELPLMFVLDGLSKAAGLPHVKLAWGVLYGAESLRREAIRRLEWIGDGFLSVSSLAQVVGEFVLGRLASIQTRILDRLTENARTLESALGAVGEVELLGRQGGWYAVLRVPQVCSEDEWVTQLAQSARVLTHPGYFYDFPSGCHVVVTLLQPPVIFGEAASRLSREIPKIVRQ